MSHEPCLISFTSHELRLIFCHVSRARSHEVCHTNHASFPVPRNMSYSLSCLTNHVSFPFTSHIPRNMSHSLSCLTNHVLFRVMSRELCVTSGHYASCPTNCVIIRLTNSISRRLTMSHPLLEQSLCPNKHPSTIQKYRYIYI